MAYETIGSKDGQNFFVGTPETTPTGLASIAQPPPVSAPAPSPIVPTSPVAPTATSSQGSNPFALSQVMTQLENQYKTNNTLMTNRNIALNALYGMPNTPEQIASLDPTLKKVLQSGDKNQIEMQIRLINDQVAGRAHTLDQSVQFLTQSYQQEQERLDKQRQDSINTVLDFVKTYGTNAKEALISLYGPQYIEQLKSMGVNIDSFSNVAPLPDSSTKYQLGYNPITGEASVFDPTTGTLRPAGSSGFNAPPAGGFRTDRNNNPTAMTTDVARTLGLVEGKDYVQGDKFPGDSNLYTAKLLGDPVQTTIKALDLAAQDPNKQAFYTASGGQRWSYIGMSDSEWQALSPTQKAALVTEMYQQEGGSGVLVGQDGGDIIDKLIAQIQQDPTVYDKLDSSQQKAVAARMAERGIQIPGKQAESGGRLSGSELSSWQGTIDDQLKSGVGLGDVRALVDNSNLQQADKEALKQYAESLSKTYSASDGFWSGLWKSLTS